MAGVRITLEDIFDVRKMFVEGELAPDVSQQLRAEILDNLQVATGVKWSIEEVDAWDEP